MAVTKIHGKAQILDRTIRAIKIKEGEITDVEISDDAGIKISKLDTSTAHFDELGHLKENVIDNSNIIDSSISFSKLVNLTPNRALEIANNGKIVPSQVTSFELNQLLGITSNIQEQIDSTLHLSGGTMSGDIDMNGHRIHGLAFPINPTDATTKAYVDSKLSGLDWQKPVKGLIREIDIPSNPVIGDRYLITEGPHINQIVEYTFSGWTFFVPDSDWAVFEQQSDQGWVYNPEEASDFKWVQFTGTGMINAGIGLSKVGNTLNVNIGAGLTELPSDYIGISLADLSGLELTSLEAGGKLRIKVDGVTTHIDSNGYLVAGDNLGNHIATQDLNLSSFKLLNVSKIGINVSDPSSLIEVGGNNVDGLFLNVASVPSFLMRLQLANSTILNIDSTGKIGIKTETPSYPLDINDSVRITGSLYLGNDQVEGGVEVKEKFYADGIQNSFTLSYVPLSVEKMDVYLNGLLYSLNDDYVVNGKVIEFNITPPANSIIQVKYRK